MSSLQPHDLAYLADRALAAIVYHRGAKPRALPTVARVDVLDHFLAPLMLEIDVDIRRLVPRLADEPFEDHSTYFRTDAGDAQAVADHRIGRATPTLAEDVP